MRTLLFLFFFFLFFASALFAQNDFDSLARSATAARESGHTEEAIASYKAALAIHPDWQEGWWYIGTLNYDADRYTQAIPAFQKLLSLNPNLGTAWNFLGLCEFETKDYANSLTHLQKGQSLDTADDPEISRVSRYHLALLLIRDSQFEKANSILGGLSRTQDSAPIRFAAGLATLHVPLLPAEIDPSREALIVAAGEAASFLNRGEFEKSVDAFAKFVRDHPDVPYARSSYAAALHADAQNDEAHGQKEKAAKRNNAAKILENEKTQSKESILAFYSRETKTLLSTVSDGNSVPEEELWNRAMAAYTAGHYEEVVADLKQWTGSKPDFGTAWAVMGLSEFELKDYDNALIHLERGEQLGIQSSAESVRIAKYHLAILLNRAHRHDAALSILSTEVGPGALASQIQVAFGMALLRVPQLPGELNPSQLKLIQSAGEIASLLEQSKYDEALPELQTLIKQNPAVPFLHYTYGTALASLSEYDRASEQFRFETQISPTSELPQIRIASLALRTHQPENALAPAKHAVHLAPSSGEAHYILGRTFLELGNEMDAIRELESASTLTPGSPEIHFNLAKAYAKAKLTDKAAEERATFARLNELAEKQRSLQANQSTGGRYDSKP